MEKYSMNYYRILGIRRIKAERADCGALRVRLV
jgi:hypothetical protein